MKEDLEPIIDNSFKKYLIIGIPRSSSTAVHLAIKGHPLGAAPSNELALTPSCSAALESMFLGTRQRFAEYEGMDATPETTAIGAKCTMRNVETANALVTALQNLEVDVRIILTLRDDLVAQYGSVTQARRTNVYHVFDEGYDCTGVRPMRLNRWLFARHAIRTLDIVKKLRTLHRTHKTVELTYEKLRDDKDTVYEELFEFLGLPATPTVWLQSKRINPPAQSYIRNYQQLTGFSERLQQWHSTGGVPPTMQLSIRAIDLAARLKRYVGRRVLKT